ncbi:MAG: hypothetical protein HQL25_06410 [Candidatus Omnitrophica bacterium]|nr:hypothetical protein [Candidatus Omnitrophota bacterium]
MSNKVHKILFSMSALLFLSWVLLIPCNAGVAVSVTPLDGSPNIRFSRLETQDDLLKEVRVRITSTEGKQYQVFQTLLDSPRNEQGQTLTPMAIKTYSRNDSNSSGTLYVQVPESLGLTDQLIYTSSPSGEGSNFSMMYMVDKDQINVSGNFFSRVQYEVRTIGSSAQARIFVNLYIDKVASQLKVSVEGANIKNSVEVVQDKNGIKEDGVVIKFSENDGKEIRIYQEWLNPPQSEDSKILDRSALVFKVQPEFEQSIKSSYAEVKMNDLIYKSSNSQDTIKIPFTLNQSDLFAGKYRGIMRYKVETESNTSTYDVSVLIDVQPIFEMNVEFPEGGVSFNKVLPDMPPQSKEVAVKVKTNMKKPYAVMQKFVTPLMNEKSEVYDSRYFTTKQVLGENQRGQVESVGFKEVDVNQNPIFLSDNNGTASEFKVLYKLEPYAELKAGTYKASVVYTLSEK